MPFTGTGSFSVYTPGNPVIAGTVINASAFNNTMQDFATGLSNTMTRDGQAAATSDIPMGGHKLTGLAAAAANGDAVRFEQIAGFAPIASPTFTGPVTAPSFVGPLTGAVTGNASTATTAANLSGTPALPNGTTAFTQASTDNSAKLATTGFVQSASIGNGQVWSQPAKTANNTYNNGTGRPIMVCASVGSSVAGTPIDLVVGAFTVARAYQSAGTVGMFVSAIVPNGYNYAVSAVGGVITTYQWAELA